jgi:hypothetical protein
LVLKPFLLGRGVETPMLVILIGAVILALAYELLIAWMAPDDAQAEAAGTGTEY